MLLALAIITLAAVVAVAAGFSIYTGGYRSSASSYGGYEPVLREWLELSGVKLAKVKHLVGPFYAIREGFQNYGSPGKRALRRRESEF